MLKKVTKFLSSLKFTIWLISLLSFMFLLGLWIPQKRLVREMYVQWHTNAPNLVTFLDTLQLTDIYASPIMLTLWTLFFINLALVMWQRLPLIKSRIAISDSKIADPEMAPGYPFRACYSLPEQLLDTAITERLRKRRYTILGDSSGFYGVKNRLSPIAFGLFHLSFFLILLGGLTSIYTEFIGYLELAEGEEFHGDIDRYVQRPVPKMPKLGTPPQVAFAIKSIVPTASGFTETGLKVQIADAKGETHKLDINKPYNVDSSSFVLKYLGVAPLFVLKDASGKELQGAYLKLDVLKGKKGTFYMGGYEFQTLFYPDYVVSNGEHTTKSSEFKNPTFRIAAGKDGKLIAEGVVSVGGELQFDGQRLELRELPFWVRFFVTKDQGIPIIYTGLFIASLAIVWRFLFFKRELVGAVRVRDGQRLLLVACRSEFYKSLAEEEFEKLFGELLKAEG
ncbi:cytochrome c biogenesis protein ResB [Geobacter sp. SVR]|uniref:cytochrome c biogenesis protein ResB n=1 Tax=Geobacter sp. SVR TaxID=2495594 RepID=UPI00143F01C3|nr:cytochrome c biogenesis protein ResB [Geobacter sp. SVR]BCS52106.1 hypothetical protein GSVR_04140 [Geobacter sp. SVR]GCF86561.1 ResB-like family cytochrome C biogenesis protein [Geobacter sp. SVR]